MAAKKREGRRSREVEVEGEYGTVLLLRRVRRRMKVADTVVDLVTMITPRDASNLPTRCRGGRAGVCVCARATYVAYDG